MRTLTCTDAGSRAVSGTCREDGRCRAVVKAGRAGEARAVLPWLTVAVCKAAPPNSHPFPCATTCDPRLPCAAAGQGVRGCFGHQGPCHRLAVFGETWAGSAQGRTWRGSGDCFWGPGDNSVCARPTGRGLHPLSQEPDGIWHGPAAPQPAENRVWGYEMGIALPMWSAGAVTRGRGALGLAEGPCSGPACCPPHIPTCPTAWHGGLKQPVHVCCCTSVHTRVWALHVGGCERVCKVHTHTGRHWRGPLQPPLPNVLPSPVGSSFQ